MRVSLALLSDQLRFRADLGPDGCPGPCVAR